MEISDFVVLFGVIITFLAILFSEVWKERIRRKEWEEERLKWERDFLHNLMWKLIETRAGLQFLGNKGRDFAANRDPLPGETIEQLLAWERERETAYGLAYAIMKVVRAGKLRGEAHRVMEQGSLIEKHKAIEDAIEVLGDRVREANKTLVSHKKAIWPQTLKTNLNDDD